MEEQLHVVGSAMTSVCENSSSQSDPILFCTQGVVSGVPTALWSRVQYVSETRDYNEYFYARFARHAIGLACAYRKNNAYTGSGFAQQCISQYSGYTGYPDLGWPNIHPISYQKKMAQYLLEDVGNPDAEKPKDRGFQDKEKPQFNIDVF